MDRETLERRLRDFQEFADASPPGPDRNMFQAIADDLRRQLQSMAVDDSTGRKTPGE